jgi:hypothetical protein
MVGQLPTGAALFGPEGASIITILGLPAQGVDALPIGRLGRRSAPGDPNRVPVAGTAATTQYEVHPSLLVHLGDHGIRLSGTSVVVVT